jgi:hypothetical protein
MNPVIAVIVTLTGMVITAPAVAVEIDWSKVDQALGKPATVQPGGVHRFGLPRTDLRVSVDGIVLQPTFALGSWIAFVPTDDGAMAMGDLVLTENEVGAVMKRLVAGGVEITAVHNHLLRMSPAVFYMHVAGHGDAVKLAETLRAGLALSHTPWGAPSVLRTAAVIDLDTAAIDGMLGFKGVANAGVYQFSIPRTESITAAGLLIPPALGTATAVNFQATGGGRAAITGDFVLVAKEVDPVLKALTDAGIEVTALHSHMVDDSPHLFFMHFWANGDATALARQLRMALDLINVKRGP